MGLKVYDPDQITVSFGGRLMSGYADGEFVRIEQDTDDFSDVAGTDGTVSRSRSNDRRATITFILMQTSESNAILSALSELDRVTPGGAGVGALQVRDRNGSTLYQADEAWISKPPSVSFDREVTSREWTLRCASLKRRDGGN